MDDAGRDDPPLTPDTLADLQAGLLDDDTAARLRKQVRDDPDARQTMDALTRVRGDVAALGSDDGTAPAVDPAVVQRIGTALRGAHSVDRGGLPRRFRLAVAAAGLVAAAVAVWVGTAALTGPPASTPSRPTTIEHITVTRAPATIPLSDQQLLALLDDRPELGPLTETHRRASCLAGLGYPSDARVLGARLLDVGGRPAVLLLLPGDTPGAVSALAVAPTCSAVDTGLMADRIVHRP